MFSFYSSNMPESATQMMTAEELCLEEKHWYAFLCSSLISFFAGLLLVLGWRIISWVSCQKKHTNNNMKVSREMGMA